MRRSEVWVRFVVPLIMKYADNEMIAMMADEMLAEYDKRFDKNGADIAILQEPDILTSDGRHHHNWAFFDVGSRIGKGHLSDMKP
jgi:hypothetical protein